MAGDTCRWVAKASCRCVAVQMQSLASSVARCAFTSGVIFGATPCALPSFEVVEDDGAVASEKLCDAGCAPVLCREWDGAGALLDFWVCVWFVEPLRELRVSVLVSVE